VGGKPYKSAVDVRVGRTSQLLSESHANLYFSSSPPLLANFIEMVIKPRLAQQLEVETLGQLPTRSSIPTGFVADVGERAGGIEEVGDGLVAQALASVPHGKPRL
jgi:hypothetical protein